MASSKSARQGKTISTHDKREHNVLIVSEHKLLRCQLAHGTVFLQTHNAGFDYLI